MCANPVCFVCSRPIGSGPSVDGMARAGRPLWVPVVLCWKCSVRVQVAPNPVVVKDCEWWNVRLADLADKGSTVSS